MSLKPLNVGSIDVGSSGMKIEISPRDSITFTPRKENSSIKKFPNGPSGIFTNPKPSLAAPGDSIRKQSPPSVMSGASNYNRFMSQTAEGVPRFALH